MKNYFRGVIVPTYEGTNNEKVYYTPIPEIKPWWELYLFIIQLGNTAPHSNDEIHINVCDFTIDVIEKLFQRPNESLQYWSCEIRRINDNSEDFTTIDVFFESEEGQSGEILVSSSMEFDEVRKLIAIAKIAD